MVAGAVPKSVLMIQKTVSHLRKAHLGLIVNSLGMFPSLLRSVWRLCSHPLDCLISGAVGNRPCFCGLIHSFTHSSISLVHAYFRAFVLGISLLFIDGSFHRCLSFSLYLNFSLERCLFGNCLTIATFPQLHHSLTHCIAFFHNTSLLTFIIYLLIVFLF